MNKKVLAFLIILIAIVVAIFLFIGKDEKPQEELQGDNSQLNESPVLNGVMTQDEALKILKGKYNLARGIYLGTNIFEYKNSGEYIEIAGKKAYKITNYNQVMNDNFTENRKVEFEGDPNSPVAIIDGVPYKREVEEVENTYQDVEFKDVKIEEDKITAIAVSKHSKLDDEVTYLENEFVIVKVEGLWLVDKYKDVK